MKSHFDEKPPHLCASLFLLIQVTNPKSKLGRKGMVGVKALD
jgi:hypothetical protein